MILVTKSYDRYAHTLITPLGPPQQIFDETGEKSHRASFICGHHVKKIKNTIIISLNLWMKKELRIKNNDVQS